MGEKVENRRIPVVSEWANKGDGSLGTINGPVLKSFAPSACTFPGVEFFFYSSPPRTNYGAPRILIDPPVANVAPFDEADSSL